MRLVSNSWLKEAAKQETAIKRINLHKITIYSFLNSTTSKTI